MTVAELIADLLEYDGDMLVVVPAIAQDAVVDIDAFDFVDTLTDDGESARALLITGNARHAT